MDIIDKFNKVSGRTKQQNLTRIRQLGSSLTIIEEWLDINVGDDWTDVLSPQAQKALQTAYPLLSRLIKRIDHEYTEELAFDTLTAGISMLTLKYIAARDCGLEFDKVNSQTHPYLFEIVNYDEAGLISMGNESINAIKKINVKYPY